MEASIVTYALAVFFMGGNKVSLLHGREACPVFLHIRKAVKHRTFRVLLFHSFSDEIG